MPAVAVGLVFFKLLANRGRLDLLLVLVLISYFASQGFSGRPVWTARLTAPKWSLATRDVFLLVLYVTALAVSMIGERGPLQVFLPWRELTVGQAMKLGSGLLLATFLPGYALIEALVRKYRLSIALSEKLVLSFLFSVALNALYQFCVLWLHVSPGMEKVIYGLISLGLIVLWVVLWQPRSPVAVPVTSGGLLLVLVVLFYVLVTLHQDVLSGRILVLDFAQHVGRALSIVRTGRPWEEESVFNLISHNVASYPAFYGIFWTFCLNMTGGPAINAAYLIDPILKIPPILAFYVLASRMLPGRPWVGPIATMVYFLFGGFVLEAAALKGRFLDLVGFAGMDKVVPALNGLAVRNSDIGFTPIFYDMIAGFRPLGISFAAMLVVLREFLWPGTWPRHLRVAIVALAAFVGFSAEVIAMVVFSVVMVPGFALLRVGRLEGRFDFYLGMGVALVAIAILDLLSPIRFFVPQLFFWVTVLVLALTRLVERLQLSRKTVGFALAPNPGGLLSRVVVALALFAYFYAWAVWLVNEGTTEHFAQIIPWFHLPVRFGVAGLFSLLALGSSFLWRGDDRRTITGICAVTLALAIFVKLVPFVDRWMGEYRLIMYPYVGLALASSVWLSGGLRRVRPFAALMISIPLLVSGFSESLLTFIYWRAVPGLPISEAADARQGMEYLFRHRAQDAYVSAVDRDTRTWSWFSGAFNNHVPVESPLFEESDPLTALGFLRYWRVGYVLETAKSNRRAEMTGMAQHWGYRFVKSLPLAYADASTRIREVPTISLPRAGAPVGLLYPARDVLPLLALSNSDYDTFLIGDNRIFSSKVIALSDPPDANGVLEDTRDSEGPEFSLLLDTSWKFIPLETGSIQTSILKRPQPPFGDSGLSVRTEGGGSHGRWILFREFASPIDVSPWDRLEFWWLGRGSGALFRFWMITGDHQHKQAWLWRDRSVGWKKIVFDLSNPHERAGSFSRTRVSALGIEPVTANVINEWAIHRIVFRSGAEAQRLQTYVNWVRRGGVLVVGGEGPGPFWNIMDIEDGGVRMVDGFKLGANPLVRIPPRRLPMIRRRLATTLPLASYVGRNAPVGGFVYAKRMGKGQVFYIDVRGLRGLPPGPGFQLGQQLLCLVQICERQDASAVPSSVQHFVRGLRAEGHIEVDCSFAALVGNPPMILRSASLTASQISETGSARIQHIELRNALLLDLTFRGAREHFISAPVVTVGEENLGQHVVMALSGQIDWRGQAGEVRVKVLDHGRVRAISLKGPFIIQIDLEDTPAQVVVREPVFAVDGTAGFDWAIIYGGRRARQDTGLVWETWAELRGRTSFRAKLAGQFMHLDRLEFSGDVISDGRITETRVFSPEVRRSEYGFKRPHGLIVLLLLALSAGWAQWSRLKDRR
ncbi:MAG TPA: hypothetical protein VGR25_13475 [bacterium]|nr:hypothetical protein [bacterium]